MIGRSVAPIWRDNVQVVERASWGARLRTREITTAALKALRCSALVWQNCVLFHYWLHDKLLGRCPKPHKGRCPLTLQGGSLDYHIKCNTAPKKERHCVRFVLE